MMQFGKIAATVHGCGWISSLHRSYAAFAEQLHLKFGGETDGLQRAFLGLVKALISENGTIRSENLVIVRSMIEQYGTGDAARQMDLLKNLEPLPPQEAAPEISKLTHDEQEQLLHTLLTLAVTLECDTPPLELPEQLAAELGFGAGEFAQLRERTLLEQEGRKKILRSGTGILVALIVIGVFILTATLLRSVVFGLIGAYLLLPLEQHFERGVRKRNSLGYAIFSLIHLLMAPWKKLSRGIMRTLHTGAENADCSAEQRKKREDHLVISQAVAETLIVCLIVIAAVAVWLSSLTGNYIKNVRITIPVNVTAVKSAGAESSGMNALVVRAQGKLEDLRMQLENLPAIRYLLDEASRAIADPEMRREIAAALLKRSGGVVSFTAGLLGTVGAILCDLLLSLFFGILFLFKLAEFCRGDRSRARQSEYLVRTVFNGHWLPGANESTIAEANRIISGMMDRLRIWARGYMILVLIDSTVYTTIFWLLKVPYFPILGILAGCGLLLPYVGPIVSATLTLLVTLCSGGATGTQLLAILCAYLIYNGIVEQFIFYPAVIGESLGLTTIETIIVVLLGALFAGIPGMIFALPAASVIKFLVPQIYLCWDKRSAKTPPAPAASPTANQASVHQL